MRSHEAMCVYATIPPEVTRGTEKQQERAKREQLQESRVKSCVLTTVQGFAFVGTV